ncbi:helix-turn-helix domain-containing protein [Saccharopolyspora cebuensis]|uniref:Helix-turn-helix domain-containing protein n=1 Tax=Saccharopolyspora cebuensis TaxID=418759 RepID=A0ABV4CG68_9PSEU
MEGTTPHTGEAIARRRKELGWTQHKLASAAKLSKSHVSKLEVGDRPATHAVLAVLARAMQVPVERLTGQPYRDGTADARTHAAVEGLRTVLRRTDLPGEPDPRGLDELGAEVAAVAKLRQDAKYRALLERLPALLEELTASARAAAPSEQARAHRLLVHAYFATHNVVHRLGYRDLAESIEPKMLTAAECSEDPLAGALAHWVRAQSFQAAGDYAHGLALMDATRTELGDELHDLSPAAIVLHGSLHLRQVTLASRAHDATRTAEHLRAARALGDRLNGPDRVHYGLTFGHANITTHETAAFVELGDYPAALDAAATWQPPKTMARSRRGHHYIDLARAHLHSGHRAESLAALHKARSIAPQQTRLHPMTRETTAVLLSLHRRSNPELTNLATWLGL